MQSLDLMRPPLDSDPAPLGDDQRVVIFLFRDDADLVCEGNCFHEVFEFEDTLQTFDAVHFFDLPVQSLQMEFFNFSIGQGRLAATTGNTLSRGEVDHNFSPC